jgi:hypothetical protein
VGVQRETNKFSCFGNNFILKWQCFDVLGILAVIHESMFATHCTSVDPGAQGAPPLFAKIFEIGR